MGKYLLLWELDRTKIPVDPKERGVGCGRTFGGLARCRGTHQERTLEFEKRWTYVVAAGATRTRRRALSDSGRKSRVSQEQHEVGLCSRSAHNEAVLARRAQLTDPGAAPVGDGVRKRQE